MAGFARGPSGHTPNPKPSDELWSECIDIPCPYCRAEEGTRCNYDGFTKHVPCTARIQAAKKTT